MDALLLTIELLSLPDLDSFRGGYFEYSVMPLLKSQKLRVLLQDKNEAIIEIVRLLSYKVGNFVGKNVEQKAGSSKQSSGSRSHDLQNYLDEIESLILSLIKICDFRFFERTRFNYPFVGIGRIEEMLLETSDCSNYEALDSDQISEEVLLIKKAIPTAETIPWELQTLPSEITDACKNQPLALLLIGGLLSFKPMTYETWNRVNDDLAKIKEFNMKHIINYCYDDLPYFLQLCFLYFARYPIDYEIPATSLIEIWIAEGFVTPEEELEQEQIRSASSKEYQETKEEVANMYLEQLV